MFHLLKERRFAPFFISMGLGAFNDNLYKSALAILIAYNLPREQADLLVQASAGLFILPFFLFSGISGQICDKFEKAKLMRLIKVLEIVIMFLAAIGLYFGHIYFLMFVLFLMGLQSTLFGPVKYSILPQHLKPAELLAGNGLVSMGTFIAILFGTMCGGLLVTKDFVANYSTVPLGAGVLLAAIFGAIAAYFIPRAAASDPDLKIKINPMAETLRAIKLSATNSSTLFAILGISWFWFFGFFFMASLPSYTRDIIMGGEAVATFLLTSISIGMGIGSIFTNRICDGETKLGLVIMGGMGLSIFSADLYFTGATTSSSTTATLLSLSGFFAQVTNWRVVLDFFMIGLWGGMYIVPLYTLLQENSPAHIGSRLIASNNIINAIFMVSAAVFAMLMFACGLNILQIFLIVSGLNLAITLFILYKIPEFFYHIVASLLIKAMYRYKVIGKENIPKSGALLVVSNHVSFIDPFLVSAGLHRPPRFLMDKAYFDIKALQWFFTSSKSIPVTPKKINPELMEQALQDVISGLKNGDMITIFPEGFITRDGQMIAFKEGVERIAKEVDVQVLPVAICGMWGSWFSRVKGRGLKGLPPNRLWAPVQLRIGKALASQEVSASGLYQEVLKLRGDAL